MFGLSHTQEQILNNLQNFTVAVLMLHLSFLWQWKKERQSKIQLRGETL